MRVFLKTGLALLLLNGMTCSPAPEDVPSPARPASDLQAGIEVRDDTGRAVRLARPVRRIVSLVPSVTETVVALGAGDRLVARTDFDRASAVAGLPSVGAGLDPTPEALVAFGPDLVVGWTSPRHRGLQARLQAAGIPFYAAAIEDTAAIFRTFLTLGALLGRQEAADSLSQAVRESLAAVSGERAPSPSPTVLFAILGDPPRTAGPGTFVAQLIEIAGGRIAFPEVAAERWPELSLEAIVARQPDVLLIPAERGIDVRQRLAARRGWRDLDAVREGRIIAVDPDLFSRPGPGVARAARELQRSLRIATE